MLCLGDLWEEIFEIINKPLKLIKQWLIENNLFFNLEKTCVTCPHALTEKLLKEIYKNPLVIILLEISMLLL